MRKAVLVVAMVLGLWAMPARAQETVNLPNVVSVDYIDYFTYANLFDPDQLVVINGVDYYINVSAHINSDKTIYEPYSAITFWNLVTGNRASIPVSGQLTGSFGSPTIEGTFSGIYAGSFVIHLQPHVGFRGRIIWSQVNSTLTLTEIPVPPVSSVSPANP